VSSHNEVWGGARTARTFYIIFSTQDTLYCFDTIILLIVDYHAGIGKGGRPPYPIAYAAVVVPRHRGSKFGRRSFSVAAPMVWNSFPDPLRHPTLSIY